MINYFIFGIGFYIGLCISNIESLKEANLKSFLMGILLGIILWPIGLIITIYYNFKEYKKN